MPIAAAATVTLYMVRSENPSSGDNAAPTHDKLQLSSGVISELLRAPNKTKAPWPWGPLSICIGLGDNTAIRYETLASVDRL